MMSFVDSIDGHGFPARTLLLSGDGYRFSADGSVLTIRNVVPSSWFGPLAFLVNVLAGSLDGKVPIRPLALIKMAGYQEAGDVYLSSSPGSAGFASPGGILATYAANPAYTLTATATDLGDARCRLDFAPGQPTANAGLPIMWQYPAVRSVGPTLPAFPKDQSDFFPNEWYYFISPFTGGFLATSEAHLISGNPVSVKDSPFTPGAGRDLQYNVARDTVEGDIWSYNLTTEFTVFSVFLPPGESIASFYGIRHLSLAGNPRPIATPNSQAPKTITGSDDIQLSYGWDVSVPASLITMPGSYFAALAGKGTTMTTVSGSSVVLDDLCTMIAPAAPNHVGPKLWFAMVPSPILADGVANPNWTLVDTGPFPGGGGGTVSYYADLGNMTQFWYDITSITASA